jgi:hypothetical protein
MITSIANFFPTEWIYGQYEQKIFWSIHDQINNHFPDQNNVLLNTTWIGEQTQIDTNKIIAKGEYIDNLFLLSTVDPVMPPTWPVVESLKKLGVGNIYKLGNFDSEHYFNFFAIVCLEHFETYNTNDLILRDIKHPYISYNRKPYVHRLTFVKELIKRGLIDQGVVTLGKPFPGNTNPEDQLYFTIGEQNQDYVKYGHWYSDSLDATPHEIPHDLFSLHNMDYWHHHFLHVIGSTSIYNEDNLFLNQINFKPLIGMRPFIINGQTRQYKFLKDQGFRTFEHYFPGLDLNVSGNTTHNKLAVVLCDAVEYICNKSSAELQEIYDHMLPDLLHNRSHWYNWAQEQKLRMENLFQ